MYKFNAGDRVRTTMSFHQIDLGAEVIIECLCIMDDCYFVYAILPDGQKVAEHIHGDYLVKSKDEITPEEWFEKRINNA